MKEAMFYKKQENKSVNCNLCPNNCAIPPGGKGSCGVRQNREGVLYSLVYSKLCSTGIDPIEKKPLFHFLPGSRTYSIATPGCNLHCRFCQNFGISQHGPDVVRTKITSPEEIVENALSSRCESISYTYVEPTIFYEYVLDTAKLAHKRGIKNVLVTNGYINQAPLKKLYNYVDACNIDLKGFTEEFYAKQCSGHLQPVLDAIKSITEMGVWVELTTLIVPCCNDTSEMIRKECEWIKKEIGTDVPLHFSRFFPHHKMSNTKPTATDTLLMAHNIAKDFGIKYVYVGNAPLGMEDTCCSSCGKALIRRDGFSISENRIRNGKCSYCGAKIAGVF